MLKLNKNKKELKLINPASLVALISAATLALSGCGNKIKRANIEEMNESSQSLLAEETTEKEAPKHNEVVKTNWNTYKESVQDVLDIKSKNSLSIENLETALLILNMDYLKANNLQVLDQYYAKSKGIDQNDEMNQLYKLLSLVREKNTSIDNAKDFISYEKLLLNIDPSISSKQNNDAKVVVYLETKVKELINNKSIATEKVASDFKEIKEFANGSGAISGLYQVDLSNDAIIATENIMQQYSVLVQNYISFEERNELDKILNSHNYLYNVEMNITELNGYARPTATAEECLKIKENALNLRTLGYEDVKSMNVTEEEYNDLFALANIDYFMRDINNKAAFNAIYGNKIDLDSMFVNAESAVEKIQVYNFSINSKEELYNYGHLYIASVEDILNTRYLVNLTYDINKSSDITSSANKLKLFNQYSESLNETTYTYEGETYRIAKGSISEGATQINNWISYYTYVTNRAKFNNDNYVDNMISLVNGSQDGLNPYDKIILMVTDFCANKNEGAFQYKIGERK